MKNIFITLFILCISFIGGVFMYAIGEKESLLEIWKDPDLFKYLSISSITVAVYLLFTHYSIVYINKLVIGNISDFRYYVKRYSYQLLYSGVGSILLSVIIASVIVWFSQGKFLHQTYYFKVDFYIVLISTILIQIIYIIAHFMISWKQYVLNNNILLLIEDEKYLSFLEEVNNKRLYLESVDEVIKFHLDNISTSIDEIAYIFSSNKVRYIVSFDGVVIPNVEMLIEEWTILLPQLDFFPIRRDLIVSKKAIVDELLLKGSRIELILNPPYKGETKLSRVATRNYKSWKYKFSPHK